MITYAQIEAFGKENRNNLVKLFENFRKEMHCLNSLHKFDISSLMIKFSQKGYLLGDFEIMNDLKTLYSRFNIVVILNQVSDHQWEIRIPDYRESRIIDVNVGTDISIDENIQTDKEIINDTESLFVIRSLEKGFECDFEHANFKHALETYLHLFNSGLTIKELKFEVHKYNENSKKYEYGYDFVINTKPT